MVDTTAWKVVWNECISCGGRYLPSQTSDPDECGICFPIKHKECVVRAPVEDGVHRPLATPLDK